MHGLKQSFKHYCSFSSKQVLLNAKAPGSTLARGGSQLMVTATTLECCNDPEVPVTVMLTCDVAGLLLDPPPHPMAKKQTRRSNPSPLIHRMLLRFSGFLLRPMRSVPKIPKPGSSAAMVVDL
jgi:hypothetical protein